MVTANPPDFVARAAVLLSGGLDSATVLAIAVEEGLECHCLTVDYGQRHRVGVGVRPPGRTGRSAPRATAS